MNDRVQWLVRLRSVEKDTFYRSKVDDIELPGLPTTIGYMSLTKEISEIAETLIRKLK